MSSLSHRRSRGPTVTRDHANLSLVPFHGETKISQTCKTGEDSFAVGENEGISMGDTRGGLPNRSFLSMCIHLRLACITAMNNAYNFRSNAV